MAPHTIVVTDGHIRLDAPRLTASDLAAMTRSSTDPDLLAWTGLPEEWSDAESRSLIERWQEQWGQRKRWAFAIRDNASDEYLGSISFFTIDDGLASATVGYDVLPEHRGRGIATAALRLACQWAFASASLHRVEWGAIVGHEQSRHIAERVGFEFEGTMRAEYDQRGTKRDVWIAGLLDTDLDRSKFPPSAFNQPPPSASPEPADETGADKASRRLLDPVEIAAGRWHLRPWNGDSRADLDAVREATTDPEIQQFNPLRVHTDGESRKATPDDAPTKLAEFVGCWTDGGHAQWALCDATTGDILGNLTLHHLTIESTTGEVGYWALPRGRGRGAVTEGCGAMTRFGVDALGLQRINLWHHIDNVKSCAIADRLGFDLELRTRESWRSFPETPFNDEHLHAFVVPR